MGKENIKAVGYIRSAISTKEEQDESLEKQKVQIEKVAKRLNMEIVKYFEQVGFEPILYRMDTLGKALEYCEANPSIEYLVVAKTARLARSLEDYVYWRIAFERIGVKIKVADGSDLNSTIGTFMKAITTMMDKYEDERNS